MKFKDVLLELLKTDNRLLDSEGELMGNKIQDLADKTDEKLIELLLDNSETRLKFFLKIKDVFVFKTSDFKFYLDENKIDNSYTQYENRIGLTSKGKFLKDSNDIVLDFPYKDCVLEGGQSTEEGTDTYFEWDEKDQHYTEKQAKRKEIFFNNVLAKDEIDRLLEPKAFTNTKRYTVNGIDFPSRGVPKGRGGFFTRDENGTIKENLIIKGNNLLALHTLKKEFAGKVKLIYIDPPYNTGNDSFAYNDNFNHSTWLTFMRNRLLVAKELLREDGVIFVQCDDNEQAFLKLLMNEVFGKSNYLQTISIKKATAAGFKSINLCPITTKEYIFIFGKNTNSDVALNKIYVKTSFVSDYDTFINNIADDYKKWNFESLNTIFYKSIGVNDWKEAKMTIGLNWKLHRQSFISNFAKENYNGIISFKDLHKPSKGVKDIMEVSKNDRDKVFEYSREGENMYFKKGRSITFYRNKIKEINGEFVPSEILSDFWTDVKWDGIAKEGNVTMKNGKKPEKLLQRILELSTNIGDIVLDYHLGSGTTSAIAHKMNRQYIGIEQMDYIETVTIERLKKVIDGEQGGISKSVNWQGGGSFVYLELAKNNQNAIEQIQDCKSYEELTSFFDEMCEKYFLHYNVKVKQFREGISKEDNLKKLSLDKQKELFVKMLDLNQLYVNVSDMEDKKYNLSADDIAITKDFYQL